jgi:GNAT superfamily N-acetyltransferase
VLLPFREEHLQPAGALLAARHEAHLAAEPLLDPRFADPAVAGVAVRTVWEQPEASGAVAVVAGSVVGYLVGAPRTSPVWGANLWVESAGMAVTDPEMARDLYGFAAQRWVDDGRTAHYVVVPAHDRRLLDAWFRLGFGQQHAHAAREVPRSPQSTGRVRVRRAVDSDVPALVVLDRVLPQHQDLSPVFASGGIPTLEEAEEDCRESLQDDRFAIFVAEVGDRVVGSAVGCSIELSSSNTGLIRPPHAGFLGYAAVLTDCRGQGVGRALGEAVLDWSAAAGFSSVTTDWRVTNLLSSRTWPRLGFRPTFLRLHRLVGH